MRRLYFDITSGIAGDMALAALIDAGASIDAVRSAVNAVAGFDVGMDTETVAVSGLRVKRLTLSLPEEHHHRTLGDIIAMIDGASLDDKTRTIAKGIFRVLAEAEAHVHGVAVDEVHFHEVGALDSIVDIVGIAAAVSDLGVEDIISAPPTLGSGTIKTAHGTMPVPAPATLKVLEGLPVRRLDVQGELTTPTGAAIVKHLAGEITTGFAGQVVATGASTGTRTFENLPNILRVFLIEVDAAQVDAPMEMMEVTLDDMTGEQFGFVMQRLFDAGAVDVTFIPCFGKKHRPRTIISVIGFSADRQRLAEIMFRDTTTAGVRFAPIDRITMDRDFIDVTVFGSHIPVKRLTYGNIKKYAPEWDFVECCARSSDIPAADIYAAASAAAREADS